MISEAWSVTMGVNEFEKWFDNVIEKCEKKYECEALKSRSAVTSPDPFMDVAKHDAKDITNFRDAQACAV